MNDHTTTVTDDEAVDLWGRVIRGFQSTNRVLHERVRSEFDLSDAETETLLTLFRHSEHRAPMSTLARAATFTTGGFTKVADRLCSRNLAERAACPEDRRVVYLGLTKEGAKLASRLTQFVADVNRELILDVIGLDRARSLAASLHDLHRAHSDNPTTS